MSDASDSREPMDAVSRLVSEEEAAAERLDRLAAAAPGSAEAARLERELGVEASLARAAYAPFEAAASERLLSAVQAQLGAPGLRAEGARERLAPVRRLRARWWVATPALAAAATLLLWLLGPPASQEQAALAPYELELGGNVRAERGAREAAPGTLPEPVRLQPGSALTLTLRPERAVQARPELRVYLRSEASAAPELLSAALERAASGALQARVSLAADLPERGQLLVLLGTPSGIATAPSPAQLAQRGAASGAGWQLWVYRFVRAP